MTIGLAGLVLAGGAGRRYGGPKALATTADGTPWTVRAVRLLERAGCEQVLVVLGAEADRATALLDGAARTVVATRWAAGLGASLAAGIEALPDADAALVVPVDLPGMPAPVAQRVLDGGTARDRLARAVYAGVPGHPVLLGRDHWPALRDSLHGDRGGGAFLEEHGAEHVECGDLFDGRDVDRR